MADAKESALLRRVAREINELISAAPLPRMVDDGTEYVGRDALSAEVRRHIERLMRESGS